MTHGAMVIRLYVEGHGAKVGGAESVDIYPGVDVAKARRYYPTRLPCTGSEKTWPA